MFVLGAGQRARRRHHGQERACDLCFGGRGLEIGDVALDLDIGISQRPVHDEARAEPLAQSRNAIVFRIEFRKRDAVLSAAGGGERVLGLVGGQRPGCDAGHAIVNVERPIAALAELAIADDVDAGIGLLAHDFRDRFRKASLVRGLVVGLAVLDPVQELDQFRRPHQAADVGGHDAIDGHLFLLRLIQSFRAIVGRARLVAVTRRPARERRITRSPVIERHLAPTPLADLPCVPHVADNLPKLKSAKSS